MKFRVFVIIIAIVCIIFGLVGFIAPAWLIKMYGSDLDLPGQFMTRYWGAALLGIATILLTQSKASTPNQFYKGSSLGAIVLSLLGLIIAIWDILAGTKSSFIWINIIIYLVATVGFTYFFFRFKKEKK